MRTKGELHSEYGSIRTNTGTVIAYDASDMANLLRGDTEHLVACWNAIESIGGDPETVGELVELVTASLLYDQSIAGRATRGEFDFTESGVITEGEDLDTLYLNWMLKAKSILAKIPS